MMCSPGDEPVPVTHWWSIWKQKCRIKPVRLLKSEVVISWSVNISMSFASWLAGTYSFCSQTQKRDHGFFHNQQRKHGPKVRPRKTTRWDLSLRTKIPSLPRKDVLLLVEHIPHPKPNDDDAFLHLEIISARYAVTLLLRSSCPLLIRICFQLILSNLQFFESCKSFCIVETSFGSFAWIFRGYRNKLIRITGPSLSPNITVPTVVWWEVLLLRLCRAEIWSSVTSESSYTAQLVQTSFTIKLNSPTLSHCRTQTTHACKISRNSPAKDLSMTVLPWARL